VNPQLALTFDGRTFDPALDADRLGTQLGRVYACLSDGQWYTLEQLQAFCGGSEAGISARLRDLRKPRFGGHVIDRERVNGGLWRYRMATHG